MSEHIQGVRVSFKVDRIKDIDPVDSNRIMHLAGTELRQERRTSCARAAGCVIESLCSDGRNVYVACEPVRSHATYHSTEEISLDGCAQSNLSAADTMGDFLFHARVLKIAETKE